jgi:hypothetical protein
MMRKRLIIWLAVLVVVAGLGLAAHQFNLAGLLLSLNPHAAP